MIFRLCKSAASMAQARLSPRDEAIEAVRDVLTEAARVLTAALRAAGIDPQHLAEDGPIPALPVSIAMERALRFVSEGRALALRLGKTHDFDASDPTPHYRYLELHLVLDELERLGPDRAERRDELTRQHGPHALLQARMLHNLVARAATVEQMERKHGRAMLKGEMQDAAEAVGTLCTGLSPDFARNFDPEAIRNEWLYWPSVLVERDDG